MEYNRIYLVIEIALNNPCLVLPKTNRNRLALNTLVLYIEHLKTFMVVKAKYSFISINLILCNCPH